jgi:hypothetical protein
MAFMGVVFLFPSVPGADSTDMNYAAPVLGGVLLLSLIWYYLPRFGGVHWFTGPVATIGMEDHVLEGSIVREKVGGEI